MEDRVSKGKRAITGDGIRKKGFNMATCSTLYCSIIIPIITYGSEIWVMKNDGIECLRKFQRYVGHKCQRFPSRSPNYSAYAPLGWISIEKVVFAKKLLFLCTILVMDDDSVYKRLISQRAQDKLEDITFKIKRE